jgi:hypothetical protein
MEEIVVIVAASPRLPRLVAVMEILETHLIHLVMVAVMAEAEDIVTVEAEKIAVSRLVPNRSLRILIIGF